MGAALSVLPLLLWLIAGGGTAPAAGAEPEPYRWPVRGPILRAFEEPPNPFAAGHRGIDIGAPLGTAVLASAGGRVAFAGVVAGSRFVSIDHPDGIRTTYSWLSRVDVRAGDAVAAGRRIGLTGHGHPEVGRPHLHFGARRGSDYLDPLVLLGASPPAVHLAPLAGTSQAGAAFARGPFGAQGLRAPANPVPDGWLWGRTEPKPRMLPGRTPGGAEP